MRFRRTAGLVPPLTLYFPDGRGYRSQNVLVGLTVVEAASP
jgi:hypothetical protein